jgi:hypothetical protein
MGNSKIKIYNIISKRKGGIVMAEHKVYSVNSQHLVVIDQKSPMGSSGHMTVSWNWEITIAVNGTDYKGLAIERSRNARAGWTELHTMKPLDEMIQHCKKYMKVD